MELLVELKCRVLNKGRIHQPRHTCQRSHPAHLRQKGFCILPLYRPPLNLITFPESYIGNFSADTAAQRLKETSSLKLVCHIGTRFKTYNSIVHAVRAQICAVNPRRAILMISNMVCPSRHLLMWSGHFYPSSCSDNPHIIYKRTLQRYRFYVNNRYPECDLSCRHTEPSISELSPPLASASVSASIASPAHSSECAASYSLIPCTNSAFASFTASCVTAFFVL
jgi:hypothetical protein